MRRGREYDSSSNPLILDSRKLNDSKFYRRNKALSILFKVTKAIRRVIKITL